LPMKRVLIGACAMVAGNTIAQAEQPTMTCRKAPMLVICSTRQPLAELKPVPKPLRGLDLIKQNYAKISPQPSAR
jgi:hypothetical protein